MNKDTYTRFRDEDRKRRADRREKVGAAIKKAGSSITVLQEVDSGQFHRDDHPVHNRASRRDQLGIRRQPARAAKRAYAERGADHRAVVALLRDCHAEEVRLKRFIRWAARKVRDLG